MDVSPRLAAALDYASRGIRVFPLVPGTKRPCFPNNLNLATTDHDTIRGWYATFGDCNIAWVPGQAGAGLFDVDRKGDVDGFPAWEELRGPKPELCPTIVTPTNGLHYIYACDLPPTQGSNGGIVPGIDTRGRGSYGLLPPSVLRISAGEKVDGEYSFVVPLDVPWPQPPENAMAALANRPSYQNRTKAPEGMVEDRAWNIARAERELRWLIADGLTATAGGRDVPCHRVACALLEYGLSQEAACELIYSVWVPVCPALLDGEVNLIERKVASAYAGMNAKGAIGCRALPEPSTMRKELPELMARVEAKAARPRFRLYSPSEHAKLPPIEFWDSHRDNPFLPKMLDGCTIVVYGARSSHKTGVVLKELVHLALNRDAKVFYVAAEGAHGIGTARLPALMAHLGRDLSDLDGKWLTTPDAPDVLNETDMMLLHEAIGDFNPDFVVFDTGTRCIGAADINNTSVGTAAIVGMENVGRPYGATVLYVTHPGKDTERGVIGSKQQENQAWGQWRIDHDAGAITLTVEKAKDGKQWYSVPMRVNTDGVPVVRDLSPADLARHAMTAGALHDELRDAAWKVIYPLLQADRKISKTDRGDFGPTYIAQGMERDWGLKNVTDDNVRECLIGLLGLGWLQVAEGASGVYVLGGNARPPGSLQN